MNVPPTRILLIEPDDRVATLAIERLKNISPGATITRVLDRDDALAGEWLGGPLGGVIVPPGDGGRTISDAMAIAARDQSEQAMRGVQHLRDQIADIGRGVASVTEQATAIMETLSGDPLRGKPGLVGRVSDLERDIGRVTDVVGKLARAINGNGERGIADAVRSLEARTKNLDSTWREAAKLGIAAMIGVVAYVASRVADGTFQQ